MDPQPTQDLAYSYIVHGSPRGCLNFVVTSFGGMEAALAAKIRELEVQSVVEVDEETTKLLNATVSLPGAESLRSKIQQQSKLLRTLKQEHGASQKRLTAVLTENDALKLEVRKLVTVKDKLELLCRELQNRIKTLGDIEETVRSEESAKRKELTDKFQGLCNEFTTRMETHMAETRAVSEENTKLRADISTLLQRNKLLQEHQTALSQQKDVEFKLLETKMTEQFKFVEELAVAQVELAKSKAVETALNERLAEYSTKYEVLRESLTQSTAFFEEFKKHKEDMDKKIKALVKERDGLARRCTTLDKSILEMVNDKLKTKEKLDALQAQRDKLQGLCRALQIERNDLRKDLAVATSASTGLSVVPDAPVEDSANSTPEAPE